MGITELLHVVRALYVLLVSVHTAESETSDTLVHTRLECTCGPSKVRKCPLYDRGVLYSEHILLEIPLYILLHVTG